MNKVNLYTILFIVISLSQSCIKPVDDFKIEERDPKIVMIGLLYPDSLVKIHLSRSIGILDEEVINPILNASVELWDQNGLIETLAYDTNGYYISSNPLPSGEKQLILKASANGYEAVSSCVTIPEPTPILSVDTTYRIRESSDMYYDPSNTDMFSYSEKIIEIKFSFEDQLDQANYYMMEILKEIWIIDYDDYSSTPVDTVKIRTYIYYDANDAIFEMNYSNGWISTVSEDENVYGAGTVFSDNLINGKTHTISLNINEYELYSYVFLDTTEVFVSLIAINEDYYKLLKCLSIYSDDPFENLIQEKVTVYTNVNNGYGLVGAAAPFVYSFKYANDTTNY